MRLRDLVDEARRRLEAAGLPAAEAALDAELLLRHVLGWDRATWLTERDGPSRPGAIAAFEALLVRRRRREPVAYIRGVQEFYGRDFAVRPGVLIPRPESEGLIDAALAALGERTAGRVADIGTGSGCLAVTLAAERAGLTVVATDISAAALEVAGANAARHGVASRIALVHTSRLDGVPGPFAVIVANPPYIRDADAAALSPEVREHEPHDALFGGDDGLREVRGDAEAAARTLAPDGALIMEIGFGQRDGAVGACQDAGLDVTAVHDDLQGIPRVVVARRRG